MKLINYNRHSVDNLDCKNVVSSLRKEKITTGSEVQNFEKNIKSFTKAKYAIASSSATSAIHISLLSIDLKKNDVVIMPAINFIAAFSMCKMMGAKIHLADVDSMTGQMTPKNIIDCIKKNKLSKIKVVFSMYLGGCPENVIEIFRLKKKYKFILIEDACHAFGSKYKYKKKYLKIGSCEHSDICTFSFHPVKPITTGEGGALTTNNLNYAKKARLFRSHNIVRNKNKHWVYNIKSFGMNYRLSDINCALGNSQIKKINKFIKIRNNISKQYNNYLKKFTEYLQPIYYNEKYSSHHLKILLFNLKKLKCNKDEIFKFFKKNKIFLQYHYIPIYKFNIANKYNTNFFVGANKFYRSAISFPIHCNLNKKELEKIFQTIQKLIKLFKKK